MNSTNESPAQSGHTKSLMILLHGLGSNGDDLFSLVPYFKKTLPDTHFYAPDGIEPCDMGPFGYQWFSLQDRRAEVTKRELEHAIPAIIKVIDTKKAELGLEDKDVILCGFSQGAMVSLYLALSQKNPYKAIVAFSGALMQPSLIHNIKTPICLIHGKEDAVVPYSNMDAAHKTLKALGVFVDTLGIPNLAHSIDMKGLEAAAKFIQSRL